MKTFCSTNFSWKSFTIYFVLGSLTSGILVAIAATLWLTSTRISTTVTTTTSTTATSSTETTTTATTTTTTTTTTTLLCSGLASGTSPPGGWGGASIIYTFDNDLNDFYGQYHATSVGSSTFVSPGFNGRGFALRTNPLTGQFVTVEKHMNFYRTNLTIEAWIYPLSLNLTGDSIIYAQTNSSVLGQYMWMMLRNGKIYGAFFASDTPGKTLLKVNRWQHIAFTYNNPNKTQTVYVDGVQDGINYNATPCLITSGIQTIGALSNVTKSVFDGYIDQLAILFDQEKSSYDILRDATLVAYYSMDCSSYPGMDNGPNQISGLAVDLVTDGGRVNQAHLFNRTTAYFQITKLILLGEWYRSFSFSMWLRPIISVLNGGTILHVSSATNGTGTWCMPFLGLDSMGRIIGNGWDGTIIQVVGPKLVVDEWIHIALTYSSTNGLRLYVNGQLDSSSNSFVYAASGVPMTVTLGQSISGNACTNIGIVTGNYRGQIDEFYIFSRELNSWEIPY